MARWFLLALLFSSAAGSASAQGLTSIFATGRNGSDATSTSFSYHRLSVDPVALALTHIQVIGGDPTSVFLSLLNSSTPVPIADVSPTNPMYLPLVGGFLLGGGNLPADIGPSAFGYGLAGGPLPEAPSGNIPTLSITLKMPNEGKRGSVSYLLDDGDLVAGATLAFPEGGWWVLGMGSEAKPTEDPLPSLPPTDDPVSTTSGPPPAVPEPATVLMVGVGLVGVAIRRFRSRS